MTTFDRILESRDKTPVRHVTLEPSAFADDYPGRPMTEVAVGLRKYSDSDMQSARAEAAKYAISMHDDQEGQIESFNDALMRWLIVRGTCDVNDITQNNQLFEGSEENVRIALTSHSIRFLFDEIERFHIETSPVISRATDEEFLVLTNFLTNPQILSKLSVGAQVRMRKLLGFCLAELLALGTEDDTEDVDDVDDDTDTE